MKKFLLILFLFFSCVTVNAAERKFSSAEQLNGIAYYKYNGHLYYFRDAKVIRDTSTGEVAYCLEPFIDLIDNSTYAQASNPVNQSNLTQAQWKRVRLLSYYGYGYKNHTDKKWISITQMTIWRYLYPNLKFEWVDNTSSKNVIHPYDNEINELNKLVNTHEENPNIDQNYKMGINETKEFVDSKGILQYYEIESSDFDARIEGNKLIIKSGEEKKTGNINLIKGKNIYNHDTLYFYNSNSQSLILKGNIYPSKYSLQITVESGSIKVTKVDRDTDLIDPQGEASLDGAVYEIYDNNHNLVAESTIESNIATFEDLSLGTYFVKEKSAGVGYYVDPDSYEVSINTENLNGEIRLGNFVIKSKIKLIKNYGTLEDFKNNKMKREKNITFNVYNKNNELVTYGITDENGEIEFELPYGEYTIKQMNTTDGYKKADDYKLIINEDNNVGETIVLNDFKVIVPNAGINIYNYPLCKVIKWYIIQLKLFSLV